MKIEDPDPELLESADIREDPELLPSEKELRITGSKTDDRLTISSEVTPAIRWIVAHPATELQWLRRVDGDIVAAQATIPRSLVLFKSKPRDSENWSWMFSKPGDDA